MNAIDYLHEYKDKTFKEVPFNEVDALLLSLASYFPLYLINKKKINSKALLPFLQTYTPDNMSEHKITDIEALKIICSCKRFSGITFVEFERKRSGESIEQFQAVTILFKDFIFVSFCGTDATLLGWREDLNMAYLDIVPSEVDAITYINKIRKKHPFKDIYIGGHSKGGRLAVRAGKEVFKKNNLKAVFSFDGPNFVDSFYDDSYNSMKHLIFEYAPVDSIIGRLISDRDNKIIVDSSAKHIMQHNGYSWKVIDDHFIHLDHYSALSNKIAKITKTTFDKYDTETKSVLVNTLFDLMEKLDVVEFKDSEYNIKLVKHALANIKIEWKNIPKENRKVVLKILFATLLLIVSNRK